MTKYGFILSALLTFFGMQTAAAQTPCQSIDTVLHSLSIVQTIQAEPNAENRDDNISRLSALADSISLSALIPLEAQAAHEREREIVSNYVSALRGAATGLKTGNPNAGSAIHALPVQKLARSMQTMTGFWNCNPTETRPPPSGETLQKVTNFSEAPKGEFDGVSGGSIPTSSDKSNSRNPSVSNMVIDRDRPDIKELLSDYSRTFYAILAMAIAALIYYLHRRSKRFKSRESRRIIHKPATARISRNDHDIIIVDISRNGLKIRHPGMIDSQRKLRIKINGTWYAANIKWANKMFAGVMFKKPINDRTFQSIVD